MATFDEYVSKVQTMASAARAAIQRQRAEIERRGEPDPDLTAQAEAADAFIAEMQAVQPADVPPGGDVTGGQPLPADPPAPDGEQPPA